MKAKEITIIRMRVPAGHVLARLSGRPVKIKDVLNILDESLMKPQKHRKHRKAAAALAQEQE